MNGMTFKEGQSPMRKINIGKKIGKFVKSRVERVVSNVKNLRQRVKSILNDDENGNGNGNGGGKSFSQTTTKQFNPTTTSSAPSSFAPPTPPKPPSASPITKKKRSGFKMKKSPAKNYKKGYYGI